MILILKSLHTIKIICMVSNAEPQGDLVNVESGIEAIVESKGNK